MALGDRKLLNPFKPLMKQLPQGLQNRAFLVGLLFLLWMLFFDKASIITQYRLTRTLRRLQSDKVFYQNKLREVELQRLDMQNNSEKFARERYYMKANDEDVFIIEKGK
jgi:cell division protein DivIC